MAGSTTKSRLSPQSVLRFLDESSALDAPLWTLAHLCEAADSSTGEAIPGIGTLILGYLERRQALEHVFLGRDLIDPADPWELKRYRALARGPQ